jgi:hypothetical protein
MRQCVSLSGIVVSLFSELSGPCAAHGNAGVGSWIA